MSSTRQREKDAVDAVLPKPIVQSTSPVVPHSGRRTWAKHIFQVLLAGALSVSLWNAMKIRFEAHHPVTLSQHSCQGGSQLAVESVLNSETGRFEFGVSQLLSTDGVEFAIGGASSESTLDVVNPPPDLRLATSAISVQAIGTHEDPSVMSNTIICTYANGEREAIMARSLANRDEWQEKEKITWKVRIVIPGGMHVPSITARAADMDSTLSINVDVRNVTFGDLKVEAARSSVRLNDVVATNAEIKATGDGSITGRIHAQTLVAQTEGGRISGVYNVSDSLELRTTNEPIEAWVILNSDGDQATRALLSTTNAPIDVDFTLSAETRSGYGGRFEIAAQSTNKPLGLYFQDLPGRSTLHLAARTTNAHIDAKMHRAYEGHVHASTTNEPVELTKLDGQDPAHPRLPDRRQRRWDYLRFNEQQTWMQGYVHWGARPHNAGSISLETTNAPIKLTV